MSIIRFEDIESKIITIRDLPVILDSDVAILYQVPTRQINKAVTNNPDKFPSGYIIVLNQSELDDLRSKIYTAKFQRPEFCQKPLPRKAFICSPQSSKAPKPLRQLLRLSKPSPS